MGPDSQSKPLTDGERIRRWRKAAGWSQDRLAGELGLSTRQLQRMEYSQEPVRRGYRLAIERLALRDVLIDAPAGVDQLAVRGKLAVAQAKSLLRALRDFTLDDAHPFAADAGAANSTTRSPPR